MLSVTPEVFVLRVVAHARTRAPRAAVYRLLSDPALLPRFEPKVLRVVVHAREGRCSESTVYGLFGPIPYRIRVRHRFLDGVGFDAWTTSGPDVSGSFRLADEDGGCRITHVERYALGEGRLARWLERKARPWVARSMGRELERLAQLAEEEAHLESQGRQGAPLDAPGAPSPTTRPLLTSAVSSLSRAR